MSDNLHATVIAGLVAIIEREVSAVSAQAANAILASLSTGSHELRVAVMIRADSTELSVGIAERATGRVVHIVTFASTSNRPGRLSESSSRDPAFDEFMAGLTNQPPAAGD
jgi:hypothetical protein